MGKTYRKLPIKRYAYARRPKFKHKLLAGESIKSVTTDWDDKPVAARKEAKHQI